MKPNLPMKYNGGIDNLLNDIRKVCEAEQLPCDHEEALGVMKFLFETLDHKLSNGHSLPSKWHRHW